MLEHLRPNPEAYLAAEELHEELVTIGMIPTANPMFKPVYINDLAIWIQLMRQQGIEDRKEYVRFATNDVRQRGGEENLVRAEHLETGLMRAFDIPSEPITTILTGR